MSVKWSIPRRPARWYPEGSVITLRDGRKFVVDVQEIKVYDEFGNIYNPSDYIYSKYRKYWRQIR